MSWGVATQNGVSVSLASIVSLSCGATEFSPASLFTSGVAGAWYDPSDVLLNWRTNLEVQTEDFSTTYCLHQGINYAANQVASPTGTITADLITENTASGDHRLGRNAASLSINSGTTYTGSVYVKRASGTRNVILRIDLGTANFGATGTNFDLTNLTVNPTAGQSATITDAGNGWYRLTITATSVLTYTPNYSLSVILSNGTSPLSNNYTGDGTSGIYAWGAQLELGSTATTYQAITTPEQTYLTYDPQPVLYQDSAGTTPVTAVEQPVGLMLDKSQGLVLGSEATSGAWLNGYTTTFDTFASTGPSSFTATTTGAKSPRVAVLASLPAAGWYWIEFTATFTGGSFTTSGFSNTGSPYSAAVATTVLPTSGVTFRTLIYTSAAREYLTLTFIASGASTLSVSGVSVKSYAGNHALQATAASRPVLRARYNLLTYSEQFDNAAWSRSQTTLSTNTATAPDGTTTADSLIEDNTLNSHRIQQAATTISGAVYTLSTYIKKNTRSWVALYASGANVGRFFNVDTGATGGTLVAAPTTSAITAVGNGWYRCEITFTATASTTYQIYLATSDGVNTYTGDGTSGIYIWGADLRTGSSAGTYQRIAAATDYATAGFAPYLAFDGVDDFLGAAYVQSAYPLTLTAGANNDATASGGLGIASVAQADTIYSAMRDGGTSNTDSTGRNAANLATSSIAVSGNKFCLSQFETSVFSHQVNGGTAVTTANTNAFGTSVNIFVGKLRPSGNFSPARDYGVVITNTVLTAAEKDSLKNWMAGKMGVTL